MRKWIFGLAMLVLTACIDVDDFGAYWDKGSKDGSLIGTWVEVVKVEPDKGPRPKNFIEFSDMEDSLKMVIYEEGQPDEFKKGYAVARTLPIADAPFLMIREGGPPIKANGTLLKYSHKGDELVFYVPEKPASNPHLNPYKGDSMHWGKFGVITIKTLDWKAVKDIEGMVTASGGYIEMLRFRKLKL